MCVYRLYKTSKVTINNACKYFLIGLSCYRDVHLLILWFPDFLWLFKRWTIKVSLVVGREETVLVNILSFDVFVSCVQSLTTNWLLNQLLDHIDYLSVVVVYLYFVWITWNFKSMISLVAVLQANCCCILYSTGWYRGCTLRNKSVKVRLQQPDNPILLFVHFNWTQLLIT